MESHRDKDVIKENIVVSKTSDDENDDGDEEYVTYLEEDKLDDTEPLDKRKLRRSGAWEYFDVTDADRKIATCNLCQEEFSYRTTSSNLTKHLKRKHYIEFEKSGEEDNGLEDDANNTSKSRPKVSAAWEYFMIKDPVRRIASCKICNANCSYFSSVSNLMKHVRRRHGVGVFKVSDDDSESEVDQKKSENKPGWRSSVWQYFKCLDSINKISVCLICKKRFSHLTSLTNLKRHLYRKHPHAKLTNSSCNKRVLISSDGQLYEIEEPKEQVADDDHDQETLDIDTVFIDDYDGDISIEDSKRKKPETTKHARKRSIMNRPRKSVVYEDSDSSGEITFEKRYVRKKNDSLDQFGKYLISLLKQLPKELSNQFQIDFVKQIIDAQLTYETQKKIQNSGPSNGYAITITEQEQRASDEVQYVTVDGEFIKDEDSDSPTKLNDLNCYFELETGGRVRCVVCRASLPQRQDAQRAHLQEKHPKLIEEQDQDEPMPFHSDDEPEQDNYTEVIYLEDARNVEKSPHKGHTSKISKWCNVKPQKRREIKKRDSTTSDEYVLKKRKNEDTDELTDFVKYISCLLRKLPSETCMKLQMDIVNLIMNATLNNQCASTVNVAAPSTSFYSTVPDKVLQTAGQVTLENISASVGTSVATSEAGPSIIISSVTENNAQ